MKVNFNETAPNAAAVPRGTYPAIMSISAYATDKDGRVATNGDGEHRLLLTAKGAPFWKLRLRVLEGAYKDQVIEDALFFSPRAKPRIETLYVRAGLIPSMDEARGNPALLKLRDEYDCQPADLAGSFWWVTCEDPEQAKKDGQPILNRKGEPFMRSTVAWEGYEPMSLEDQTKYRGLVEVDETPF